MSDVEVSFQNDHIADVIQFLYFCHLFYSNIISPLIPTRISSFRCSFSMVLALLDTGEALRWGKGSDGTMVIRPWQVKKSSFPREVFASGWDPDSGGTVYLGTTTFDKTMLFFTQTEPFHNVVCVENNIYVCY